MNTGGHMLLPTHILWLQLFSNFVASEYTQYTTLTKCSLFLAAYDEYWLATSYILALYWVLGKKVQATNILGFQLFRQLFWMQIYRVNNTNLLSLICFDY